MNELVDRNEEIQKKTWQARKHTLIYRANYRIMQLGTETIAHGKEQNARG